jgi:hypothetical protein
MKPAATCSGVSGFANPLLAHMLIDADQTPPEDRK